MGSIDDWAAKASNRIVDEVTEDVQWRNRRLIKPTAERIAAIIAWYAKPLEMLLLESRRAHKHGEHGSRCCPQCCCKSWPEDPEGDFEPTPNSDNPCTCGASEWNARIDTALNGQ